VTDDRDWSWLHRPTPAPTAPVEHILWALVKRTHRVECRARWTPAGPELRILLDCELWWSQVVRPATEDAFTAAADTKRNEFEAKGWQVAGPAYA